MVSKNTWMMSMFFFIATLIFTIICILVPKGYLYPLLIFSSIVLWIIYDRYVVEIMGWHYIWWSPHVKQLIIDKKFIKMFVDPKITIISYFLSKKYDAFYFSKQKNGLYLGGERKKIRLSAKLKNDDLKITFWPLFSKPAVNEMKEFEKYIKEE